MISDWLRVRQRPDNEYASKEVYDIRTTSTTTSTSTSTSTSTILIIILLLLILITLTTTTTSSSSSIIIIITITITIIFFFLISAFLDSTHLGESPSASCCPPVASCQRQEHQFGHQRTQCRLGCGQPSHLCGAGERRLCGEWTEEMDHGWPHAAWLRIWWDLGV